MKSDLSLYLLGARRLCCIFFIASLGTLAGCATSGGAMPVAETQSNPGIVMIHQASTDAWNRHDAVAVANTFSETGTYQSPQTNKPISGVYFKELLQNIFTAIPDWHVEVVSVSVLSETTLVEQWVATGTWTKPFARGPLAGIAPTGKSFKIAGAEFVEIQGGKIQSEVLYFDQLSLRQQMGITAPVANNTSGH